MPKRSRTGKPDVNQMAATLLVPLSVLKRIGFSIEAKSSEMKGFRFAASKNGQFDLGSYAGAANPS
jgi:hypothetical protein